MAGSFQISRTSIERLGNKLAKHVDKLEKKSLVKMNAAINIIYNTARAKRASIEGAPIQRLKVTTSKGVKMRKYRVSDPKAPFGVPVRTGALQSSIKKEVKSNKWGQITGRVYVDMDVAPYAKFVEYGTSRMKARPFMRPAWDLNKETVKRMFKDKSSTA